MHSALSSNLLKIKMLKKILIIKCEHLQTSLLHPLLFFVVMGPESPGTGANADYVKMPKIAPVNGPTG